MLFSPHFFKNKQDEMKQLTNQMNMRVFAMGLSLSIAVLMLAGKLTAFFITGSSAILSDAAESIVHILASGVAAFSLWFSMQAPDHHHPYGHGKIAYFSAGFEGALIGVAAVTIILLALRALITGAELHELHLGLLITAALAAINCALGLFLVWVGKHYHSLVLTANGKHVLTDMWTSLGVLVGVTVVWLTGLSWLDPLVAILVALHILYTAYALMRNAFQGLLDEADPHNTRVLLDLLEKMVAKKLVSGYHQLRHRQTENVIWIEMHLLMPDTMSTGEAHNRTTELEEAVRALFPERIVQITTHVEPDQHHAAHPEGHDGPEDPYIAC